MQNRYWFDGAIEVLCPGVPEYFRPDEGFDCATYLVWGLIISVRLMVWLETDFGGVIRTD